MLTTHHFLSILSGKAMAKSYIFLSEKLFPGLFCRFWETRQFGTYEIGSKKNRGWCKHITRTWLIDAYFPRLPHICQFVFLQLFTIIYGDREIGRNMEINSLKRWNIWKLTNPMEGRLVTIDAAGLAAETSELQMFHDESPGFYEATILPSFLIKR